MALTDKLHNIAEAIRNKTGKEEEFTLEEMVDEINDLNIVPEEGLIWTGSCQYRGSSYYGYGWFFELFKNKIVTNDIQDASNMFYFCGAEEIPFDLNFTKTNSSVISSIFYGCQNLTSLPRINNLKIGQSSLSSLFYDCNRLRQIEEDWAENFDWSKFHSYAYPSCSQIFYCCYSLRKIPQNLITNIWGSPSLGSGSYYPYIQQYYCCRALEELENIPVVQTTNASGVTSNLFTNTFYHCSRLKKLTFQPIEENVKWKTQVVDLSYSVGYVASSSYITNYNSGLTTATQITDDATYQILKNNPDSWTTNTKYSRYNHDSAVETINSLPDTHNFGTNTIKFKGQSGELTDGGAINTLTAEEIAVASAKGWTVTLV